MSIPIKHSGTGSWSLGGSWTHWTYCEPSLGQNATYSLAAVCFSFTKEVVKPGILGFNVNLNPLFLKYLSIPSPNPPPVVNGWRPLGEVLEKYYTCHTFLGSFLLKIWPLLQSLDSRDENWLLFRSCARDHDFYWVFPLNLLIIWSFLLLIGIMG